MNEDGSGNNPQDVLVNIIVLALTGLINNNAQIANQFNPNESGGVFLDAIAALTGLTRSAATYSYATVNVTGVPGTVIPIGSTVTNVNQEVFAIPASGTAITLDGSGNGSGVFQAVNSGPIAAPAGTLTTIVNGVIGWETATNPADAALGTNQQTDANFRLERQQTVGLEGSALAAAIIGGVNLVEGVTSVSFRENIEPTIEVVDGVTMAPNSIYVCVTGGTNLAVATAIYSKKSGGCQYTNGASANPVSQVVVDPVSGQSTTVLFDRPTNIPVLSKTTIAQNSAIVNPVGAVTQAILDYVSGNLDGQPGFQIGASVSCFELSGAVQQEAPNLYVINSQTTLASAPLDFSNNPIPIAIFEQATINESSITVVVV